MRVYLIGFMGSGKSHWGRLLSERLQFPFYDLDDVIVVDKGGCRHALPDGSDNWE